MDKKDLIRAVDNFELDDNLKYKVQRKVNNIMRENQQTTKKAYRGRRVAVIAACLVAVVGLSAVAVPVMADNIPALQSLITKLEERNSQEPTNGYTNPIQSTPDNAEPVAINSNEDCMSVYVDSYYCDDNNLVVFYGINANNENLAKCNNLAGDMQITINGKTYNDGTKASGVLWAKSNQLGLFLGEIDIDLSKLQDMGIDSIQDANIGISFSNFSGCEINTMRFNYDTNSYEQFRTDKYNDTISFDFDVTSVSDTLVKTYQVNQTQGNNTLNSVSVSPFCTSLDINTAENYYVVVKDSTGKTLELKYDQNYKYDTPSKDAASISIEVYNVNGKDPEYTFNVPIDYGYSNQQANHNDNTMQFIPAISEVIDIIKPQAEEYANKNCVALGTPDSKLIEGCTMTVNNYEIADTLNGLEIMDDEYNSQYCINADGSIKDGYKAIILDVTVENTTNNPLEYYRQFQITTASDVDVTFYTEPHAFDSFENNGKSAYKISLDPNETRNIKVAFVVSDDALNMPLIAQYATSSEDVYSVRLR